MRLFTSLSNMSLLAYVTAFVLMLLLFLVPTELYLRKNLSSENRSYLMRYSDFIRSGRHYDTLIVGSSRATHGIEPSYLESAGSCFNFSFNGATPAFYDDIAPLILQNKPKRILYSVNWFMFDNKWLWRKAAMDKKFINEYYPYVLSENNLIKALLFARKNKLGQGTNDIIISRYDKGFVPYSTPYDKDKSSDASDTAGFAYENELNKFDALLSYFKKNTIDVVLVDIPEYIPGRITCRYIKHNYDLLYAIARKHDIPFLDYNNSRKSYLNYDRSCYSDWTHFNNKGAVSFSRMLSADLAAMK